MTSNGLAAAVERLRRAIAGADFRDPQARHDVESLIGEIERGAAGGQGPNHELRDRLAQAIRRFEVEHPVVTGCLGQIAAALAAMGI